MCSYKLLFLDSDNHIVNYQEKCRFRPLSKVIANEFDNFDNFSYFLMQRYLGFRNAKIKTDMSVFLEIENEFDTLTPCIQFIEGF